VVFVDIVSYSKLTVARQQSVKAAFNEQVASTVARIPVDERILLDTGDGAALCFVGDPEDALFVSLDLRNAFAEMVVAGDPFPAMRIGINLGPVRVVQDVGGRMNLIGDGINVGQRIMSFCNPNQILVARSYYEVVGCLSRKHAALFHYRGERKDKHVREHVIYEVSVDQVDVPSVDEAWPIDYEHGVPDLDEAVIAVAEKALASDIGPLARVIVKRAQLVAHDADSFFKALSLSIPEGPRRDAFLARLGGHGNAPSVTRDNGRVAQQPVGPAPTSQEDDPDEASDDRKWTPDDLQLMELELAKYLGPLAPFVVRKAAQTSATTIELINVLAEEIADPVRRERFLAAVAAGKR
jgi:class 3 adenylate cyclase